MREHIFILKCLRQASPFYLPIHLLNMAVSFIDFLVRLLFYRHIIDYFAYQTELSFTVVVSAFMAVGVLHILAEILQHWTDEIYGKLEQKKISEHMRRMIYKKCSSIEISKYEQEDFYNQYVRAIEDAPERVSYTVGLLCNFLSSGLKIVVIGGMYADLGIIFGVIAVLYCMQSLMTVKQMNQLFYRGYLEDSPVERRISYISSIFRQERFAKETNYEKSIGK